MLMGSCLCGTIKYQLMNEIDTIVFCHCSRCRKETGSAFNTASAVNAKDMHFIAGKDSVKIYAQNGVNRHFCMNCGSKIFTSRDNAPDVYRVRVGTLDSTIRPTNKIHIFTASKANWDDINDNNPQHSGAL